MRAPSASRRASRCKLIKSPPFFGAASFGFDTFENMSRGMAAAAREGVVADNFGLDPKLQQGQLEQHRRQRCHRRRLGRGEDGPQSGRGRASSC